MEQIEAYKQGYNDALKYVYNLIVKQHIPLETIAIICNTKSNNEACIQEVPNEVNGVEIKPVLIITDIDDNKDRFQQIHNQNVIYMWYNTETSMPYIGSATDPYRRYTQFLTTTQRYAGKEINKAREKYELDKWIYFVLEIVEDKEQLISKENYYIAKYNSMRKGYNARIATKLDVTKKNNKFKIL